jgi:predicted HTH domain antitoxin
MHAQADYSVWVNSLLRRWMMNTEAPMTAEVLIGTPRDVMRTTRMSPDELKRELALTLFQQGKVSFGKARELTGMTVWAFQQLLGSREIPVHYDVEDYLEDRTVLETLGQP